MKTIKQFWVWIQKPLLPLETIELAGRTCYKSEDKITPNSSQKFVTAILKRGHESVIEHVSASVRFVTNRGVTHELVRHRLCSFSQESTRYCNYGGDDIVFIRPVWEPTTPRATAAFETAMLECERMYNELLKEGWRPEQAREVLPNALKTEIVVTANLREWRHIFSLRCSNAAHPQIRELMRSCLSGFREDIPVLFDTYPEEYYGNPS